MDELARKINGIDWNKLQRQAKKVQASTASAMKDLVVSFPRASLVLRHVVHCSFFGISGSPCLRLLWYVFSTILLPFPCRECVR